MMLLIPLTGFSGMEKAFILGLFTKIWPVNPADTALFYVIACVWGMADGVWNTQINGYWVDLVGTESLDFAYTNYRIWEALGSAFGFALIRLLTVKIYLLVSCGVLCIGMICLGIISYYGFFSKLFRAATEEMSVACLSRKKQAQLLEESMMTSVTRNFY